MAKTFWADCTVLGDANRDTAAYLERQWNVKLDVLDIRNPSPRNANGLGITVRDYPEIMIDVEKSGYFEPQVPIWQIMRISPDGLTLYLVNTSGMTNDGRHHLWEEPFIFIPMSNVIAIHNVSQQFFINESVSSVERLARNSEK